MPREYSGCKFGDNLASADRRYSIPLGRRDRGMDGKKTTESASIFARLAIRVEGDEFFRSIDVTVDTYGYGLRILFCEFYSLEFIIGNRGKLT